MKKAGKLILATVCILFSIIIATAEDNSGMNIAGGMSAKDVTTGDYIKSAQSGQLTPINNAATGGKVLWDLSHGVYGSYQPSGYFSTLVRVLAAKGYTVETTSTGVLNANLSQYKVVVINLGSAWYTQYTPQEVSAIKTYVQNGGGLLIMGDNTGCPNANINPVAQAFGTTTGVSEMGGSLITKLAVHPIFNGVTRFDMAAGGEINGVLPSQEVAWYLEQGAITVATYGSGNVVVTGDINMLDNNYIILDNNQLLGENIFDWLSTPSFVSISTDKQVYSPGSSMTVTIGIQNPTSFSMTSDVNVYLKSTDMGFDEKIASARLTMAPGFHKIINKTIPIGNLGSRSFNATWSIEMVETVSPYSIIDEASTTWKYSATRGASELKPEEIVTALGTPFFK